MIRRTPLVAAMLLICTAASAATISFSSSPGEGSGYLALPAGGGKHPALIVIQEWWGLNDWIREQTDRFAKQGYVALAPDLYRGKSTSDPQIAHELSRGLPHDRAMADLEGAFRYLAARNDVDPSRIGVIGWCMGGGYALQLAVSEPGVAATVMNYGALITNPDTIAKLRGPLLGNFGAEDHGIPKADVTAFGTALEKAGKTADIKIYEGAGHAFMNSDNKTAYVKSAADDAWKRIDAFFARVLRPA